MSKTLILSLLIIALIIFVILNNHDRQSVNLVFAQIQSRESIVMLSFFIIGIISGVLLK